MPVNTRIGDGARAACSLPIAHTSRHAGARPRIHLECFDRFVGGGVDRGHLPVALGGDVDQFPVRARRDAFGLFPDQSFVLLVHDPEPILNKGSKMDITHWLIWNIPGTSTGLPEGVMAGELPDGSRQVSLRGNGYMGPGAPAGPYHHYTFELYALDAKLDVPQGTPQQAADTRTAVVNAMDGHVLGKAVLVARFHR